MDRTIQPGRYVYLVIVAALLALVLMTVTIELKQEKLFHQISHTTNLFHNSDVTFSLS